MWPYKEISRDDFEKIKDHIEEIMSAHGAVPFDIDLPYLQKTTTYNNPHVVMWEGQRKVYKFNDLYYRLDEVCFLDKPFIVVEIGSLDELVNNIMEDSEPFPYNLTEEEFDDEVSYFLKEKPYPHG